jgi:hypothetical protein
MVGSEFWPLLTEDIGISVSMIHVTSVVITAGIWTIRKLLL